MQNNNTWELPSILNGISDGFLVLETDWSVIFCNAAFEKITGANSSEFAHNIWEVFDKVEGLRMREQLMQVIESKAPRQIETFIPQNEQWLSVDIYPSEGVLALFFQDITIKKQEQDPLLIDEHNLHILINITDQPVWLVDRNCSLLFYNEPFKTWITYFTGKELHRGDNVLSDDLGKSYLDKFRMCYELALSGKTFNTVEDMMVEGELKFTTISFNPVYDSNVITGICCHATDITDQRKNLSRLDAQTQLLLEIANIQSHKVRGPVATLLGFVHVFNFDDPADPDNLEVMRGVASVAKRLDTIVREVIRSINLLNKKG